MLFTQLYVNKNQFFLILKRSCFYEMNNRTRSLYYVKVWCRLNPIFSLDYSLGNSTANKLPCFIDIKVIGNIISLIFELFTYKLKTSFCYNFMARSVLFIGTNYSNLKQLTIFYIYLMPSIKIY